MNVWHGAAAGLALLALTAALAQDGAGNPGESQPQGHGEGGEARDIPQVEIGGGPPPSEKTCFYVRNIRSFDAFDNQHVYARGGKDEHFLLTMFGTCPGLEGALRIAISNDIGRVCSNSAATITYREFGTLESCRVKQVESVETKDDAKALVASRERASGRAR